MLFSLAEILASFSFPDCLSNFVKTEGSSSLANYFLRFLRDRWFPLSATSAGLYSAILILNLLEDSAKPSPFMELFAVMKLTSEDAMSSTEVVLAAI